MVRNILVGLSLLLACRYSYAQTSTCAQTLRLVRSTYELGRFHEIPGLLEKCLQRGEGNFTKQEKVEALKILTLAYLYSEDPEQADQAMLELLKTDHFFEINENVDPAEFTALYRTFRTKPLFALGLRFGANTTLVTAKQNFFVGATSANQGEYSPGYNIQIGASFEKALFEKREDSRWTAAPEFMYINHSYGYANESLTVSDQTGERYANMDGAFKQSRIDVNVLIQYKIKSSLINPYVTFGGGPSLLLASDGTLETVFTEEGTAVSGPSVDLTNTQNRLDFNAIVGAGLKYKFGEIYLLADVRYKYGLANATSGSSRTNPEAAFDYGFVSNNLNQSSVIASIGFIWPYFKPKKLLR